MATKSTTAKKASKKATKKVVAKTNGNKPKSKTAIVTALLLRKSGCTRKDVLKATGWKAVSMQQMAYAAGLKLKLEKMTEQRGLVYFGKK